MLFAGDEIGLEGVLGEDSRRPFPWQHPEAWDEQTLATYAALARLRHEHEALRRGGLRWAHVDDDALVFLREHPAGSALVAVRRAAGAPIDLRRRCAGLRRRVAAAGYRRHRGPGRDRRHRHAAGEPRACAGHLEGLTSQHGTAHRGQPAGPGPPRAALVGAARGVDRARRAPAARALAPRGADRAARRQHLCGQGDGRGHRVPRVPAAARPAADGAAGGGRAGRGHRPGRRARRGAPGRAAHPAPAVLAALPQPLLPRAERRQPAVPGRRHGGAAGPAAPRRLLLGRRVAVQRALPAQRRRVRGVPRRRRDRRAEVRASPTACASTT